MIRFATFLWLMNPMATLFACASSGIITSQEDLPSISAAMESAMSLRDNGRFLEAGYYLESMHPTNEEEASWLLLLIECQIRSGRLLAARFNLERFLFLQPGQPEAQTLHELLSRVTGTGIPEEVYP